MILLKTDLATDCYSKHTNNSPARLSHTVVQNTTRNCRLEDLCRNSRCATSAPGQPPANASRCKVASEVRQRPALAAALSIA